MVFGGFILCAETCLHFPDMLAMRSWVDFPLNDWFAGGFLVYGGIATRRDWLNGRAVQAAAWAFMCSLLAAAFIAHWDDWTTATKSEDDWISPRGVVAIIGVLLIISVGGMVSTLAKQREQP